MKWHAITQPADKSVIHSYCQYSDIYPYSGITSVLYMNLWLGLVNCLSVAQLVRALHRNRRAAGSIPARRQIVAFFAPG